MPSFRCSCCCDEFIKTQKQKGNEMKKEVNASYNKNKDISPLSSSFSEKTSKLPLCFDIVFGSTVGYLKNNIDAKTYSEIFVSEASFVYQTAQYGVDKEEFSQKYTREIGLIKQLNSICDLFKNSECNASDFDSQVNTVIKDYVQS